MEQQQTWRRELPNYKQVAPEIEDLPFQAREAINVLRGNIQLSGANLKVIAITSAVANEGKSSIAFRLTKSLAGLKKRTLYLDCDIRNSVTMSRYGMSGQMQGLTEYLCGAAAMNDIVYRTPDKYMDVILTGAVAPNPSELVSGKLFTLLLDEMRKRYDYIIVDTPPINPVIDGDGYRERTDRPDAGGARKAPAGIRGDQASRCSPEQGRRSEKGLWLRIWIWLRLWLWLRLWREEPEAVRQKSR